MNGLPYYKAYPRDFIEGTIGMDFETKAAYRLVLDLIYMQGGSLPDDARYISGLLGCSIKKWNLLRKTLVDAGKIDVRGEFLGNYRADKELESLGTFQEKQRKNRSNQNKNNEIKSPPPNHTEPDTYTEASKPPLPPVADETVSPKFEKPPASAPTRTPADGSDEESKKLRTGVRQVYEKCGSPTLPDTAYVGLWLASGYRRDLILAVIEDRLSAKRAAGGDINRLSYYDAAIREAHEREAKQPAAAPPVDEGKRLNYLRSMVQEWQREPTTWPPRLGPRPDDAGCTVPANILAEFGIQSRERRAA